MPARIRLRVHEPTTRAARPLASPTSAQPQLRPPRLGTYSKYLMLLLEASAQRGLAWPSALENERNPNKAVVALLHRSLGCFGRGETSQIDR